VVLIESIVPCVQSFLSLAPVLGCLVAAAVAVVKLACEKKIEGSLGNGSVDWVALHQNYWICMITEGKKTTFLIESLRTLLSLQRSTKP
jgi:hypothetical protein